jgi:hypothetical protein
MAAFPEQTLWMRFLEVISADLGRRNMSRNGKHGNAGAMAVEQTVDQMQIARPAAAGADCKFAGQVRLGTGRERGHFLMANMHPFHFPLATNGIGQAVEAVSDHAINALHTSRSKRFNKLISNSRHVRTVGEICIRHTITWGVACGSYSLELRCPRNV